MIEVIKELKWKDEVLVKIPFAREVGVPTDDTLIVPTKESFLSCINDKFFKERLSYNRLHCIDRKDISRIKGLGTDQLLMSKDIYKYSIGTIVSLNLEYACVSLKESYLKSLYPNKDYRLFLCCCGTVDEPTNLVECTDILLFTLGLIQHDELETVPLFDINKTLKDGQMVIRYDWDGYWLEYVDDDIKVVSKHNRVVSLDEIPIGNILDEMNSRSLYYILPNKSMADLPEDSKYEYPFYMAMILMTKLGFCMRREIWPRYFVASFSDELELKNSITENVYHYNLTTKDIIANDWVIVDYK
mgnify:CR=1 FL=1